MIAVVGCSLSAGITSKGKELHCKTTSSKVIFFLDTFRELLGLRNEDFLRFGSDELPFVRSPVYWDWTRKPEWEEATPWSLRPDLAIRVPSRLAKKETEDVKPVKRSPEPPSTWLEPDCPSDFLESHLSHHFGFESYRPGQKTALLKILNGQDALEVLPTGTGKSLIYLQAACLLHGAILVISPLISLIQDQVLEARAYGLVAYPLHASGRREYLEEVRKRMRNGRVDILFMPPEAWEVIVRALPELKRNLGLIVIDEAHVIPAWGPSFRQSYLTLDALGMAFPKIPMLALTATATPETQKGIIEGLGLQGLEPEPSSVFRPNLFLRTKRVELPPEVQERLKTRRRPGEKDLRMREALFEARWKCLKQYLESVGEQRGIIYCSWRDETTELARRISKRLNLNVEAYHGGMDNREREAILLRFKSENSNKDSEAKAIKKRGGKPLQIMVATMAFGMGINVTDVKFVVHFGMGSNLESYAQEIGRGGRDESWAECLLIWAEEDFQRHLQVIKKPNKNIKDDEDMSTRSIAQTIDKQKRDLGYIRKWMRSKTCRHASLDRFFGVHNTPTCRISCEICWDPKLVFPSPKIRTYLAKLEPINDVPPENEVDIGEPEEIEPSSPFDLYPGG